MTEQDQKALVLSITASWFALNLTFPGTFYKASTYLGADCVKHSYLIDGLNDDARFSRFLRAHKDGGPQFRWHTYIGQQDRDFEDRVEVEYPVTHMVSGWFSWVMDRTRINWKPGGPTFTDAYGEELLKKIRSWK